MDNQKQFKDNVYELLKEPSREKFREFIQYNTGESNNIDFKSQWIDDKASLSKLFLSLSNSGGGIIIFGIKENTDGTTEPIGIEKFEDNANINSLIKKYIPSTLEYNLYNFDFNSSEYDKLQNKKFQIIVIKDIPQNLPYLSTGETTGLDRDTIYIRRGTKCEKATSADIEKILNRRIETQYSSSSTLDLTEHLNQLKTLYSQVERYNSFIPLNLISRIWGKTENPNFPEEDYETFVIRMITNKKIKIEKLL